MGKPEQPIATVVEEMRRPKRIRPYNEDELRVEKKFGGSDVYRYMAEADAFMNCQAALLAHKDVELFEKIEELKAEKELRAKAEAVRDEAIEAAGLKLDAVGMMSNLVSKRNDWKVCAQQTESSLFKLRAELSVISGELAALKAESQMVDRA